MRIVLALALIANTALAQEYADEWLKKPVDDKTFGAYLEFFTVDNGLPFEKEILGTEVDAGQRIDHVSFVSTPEERVFAYFYHPVGESSSKRVIIRPHHGPRGKGAPWHRRSSTAFARAGWGVLAIDVKYFGERDTGLMTTFTEKDKHDQLYNQLSRYRDWVVQTVRDVRRSYDFLVSEGLADPNRVVLFGRSRTAVAGSIAAGVEDRLAAVVLVHGGHFDALERDHLAAACPANYIGRIHPTPLLTINARNDGDFNPETSIRPLLRLAGDSHDQIWTDGGHGDWNDEVQAKMMDWLRTHVQ